MGVYTESFIGLVDQLRAYGSSHQALYFAMKYVDGLHDGIKAIVTIHHPLDFDTCKKTSRIHQRNVSSKCLDYSSARPPFKLALPLPPPPPWVDKPVFPYVDDRHGTKAAQARTTPEKWFALALIVVPVVYVRSVLKIAQRTIAVWILFNSM